MSDTLTAPVCPARAATRRAGEPLLALWTPAPGIFVALARIEQILASSATLDRLRPEEHRSAAAMAPWRGREHLAGRALLRLLLADELGEEAARGPVVAEPAGRPRLPGRPGAGISVSHSGPYTAAAMADGQDVGVDVQTPRPPSPGMLRRCCPPDTASRLATLAPDRAAYAFARVWAVQEACVKARGTGLSGAPWTVPADPDAATGTWQALHWRRLAWPGEAGTEAAALVCAYAPPDRNPSHPPPTTGAPRTTPQRLSGRMYGHRSEPPTAQQSRSSPHLPQRTSMRTDPTAPTGMGLSCYTENLAGYLAARTHGSTDLLARSVRLAVDPDTGAFSHHGRALNNLPGGRRLGYRGAPDTATALAGLDAELTGHGRALAVADSGALPWLTGSADDHAPHLLVVDGRTPDGHWHVVDGFTALFSSGSQDPFAGTVTDEELRDLLAFPRGMSPVHRTRNNLAFGFPVEPPAYETYQWLAEEEGTTEEQLPGGPWLTGAAALHETARLLLADMEADGSRGVLEDVWAAAQHHLFRDAHLLAAGTELSPAEREAVGATTAKWRELPRMLRFAANSSRRGRPRPSLVTGAFTTLADLEAAASPLHTAHGYGVAATRPADALQGG